MDHPLQMFRPMVFPVSGLRLCCFPSVRRAAARATARPRRRLGRTPDRLREPALLVPALASTACLCCPVRRTRPRWDPRRVRGVRRRERAVRGCGAIDAGAGCGAGARCGRCMGGGGATAEAGVVAQRKLRGDFRRPWARAGCGTEAEIFLVHFFAFGCSSELGGVSAGTAGGPDLVPLEGGGVFGSAAAEG